MTDRDRPDRPARVREPGGAPPRVASWPHAYGPNPYLPALYDALAGHGVEHVPYVPLEAEAFRGPDRRADFLHLHWLYPLLREGRGGFLSRLRTPRTGVRRIEAVRAEGVPVLWTVHNVVPHDGFRRGERAAYARLAALADLTLLHSRSALAEVERAYGARPAAPMVVPHGAYHGRFPAPRPREVVRAELGVAAGTALLLCFGQIRTYKGFDLAVRALASLRDVDVHLVVAGRPIDRSVARLRRLASRDERFTLIAGELPAQRLADLLEAADVALLPYRSITGSGALLHALTARRGVVASDLPYFREVLAPDPDAGVLFTAGNPEALADAIRAFLGEAPTGRADAAERLAARYAWAHVVRPLADWIHDRHGGS